MQTKEAKSIMLAFLGPDGCGKSTIIERVRFYLPQFKDVSTFHLSPSKGVNVKVTHPHSKIPYGFFLSYIKLGYLWLVYLKGYLLYIFPKQSHHLFLFDRYYDDILVDPVRFRYGGSRYVARMIRKIIPEPDLYFVFTGNAEVFYERKQELDPQEIRRQLNIYKSMIDGKKYIEINGEENPEDIIAQVKSKINELC